MAMSVSSWRVAEVAAELLARGVVLGQSYSVGRYRPAVADRPHEWVVVDLRGAPRVFAHDAFEASLWFAGLEAGEGWFGEPGGLELKSDAEVAEDLALDRRDEYAWRYSYYNLCLDHGRKALAEARGKFLGVLANTKEGGDHA